MHILGGICSQPYASSKDPVKSQSIVLEHTRMPGSAAVFSPFTYLKQNLSETIK